MNNNGNLFDQVVNDNRQPGNNLAIAALVLGILSVLMGAVNLLSFMGVLGGVTVSGGLVAGIVGAALAGSAKKKGNTSSICSSGQVLSVIGIVANALLTVGCLGCAGCASCAVCAMYAGMMA